MAATAITIALLAGGAWGAASGLSPVSFPEAIVTERPFVRDDVQKQARVRGEIVVRIAPIGRDSSSTAPATSLQPVETEAVRRRPDRGDAQCVPLAEIAGVRLGERGSILLYMSDSTVYSAPLDKTCRADSFYSGFYVERPDDGLLCAGREALHARSGEECMLGKFDAVRATAKSDEASSEQTSTRRRKP